MKQRIIIFSTAYLPLVGGAEVAIKELTDRMSSSFSFDLITARIRKDLPKEERIGNVNVYRVGFGVPLDKFLLPLIGLSLALRLHKKHQYSLVWAMMASQASVLAVFFSKLKKVKLLTTLQEGDEEAHLERYAFGLNFLYKLLIRPWHRLAIRHADHIQVISNYLKHRALAAGAQAPVSVIPNGVDLGKFTQEVSDKRKNELRNELEINESEYLMVFNSRLAYKNSADTVIRSLVHLPQTVRVKLLLMGSGPEEIKLKSLTEELQLEKKVLFMGGYNNEDLPEYLSIADLMIRPSRSEGQGISFIEAMAAGVPVIATPVGGIPDFLKDRETGLFCKVDDPADQADKIRELLTNHSLREHIIVHAKKLMHDHYDWDVLAGEMKEMFEAVINA